MPELSTLGEVIKTAYEGQSDTEAFTTAEKAKLAGIEDGAQVNPEPGGAVPFDELEFAATALTFASPTAWDVEAAPIAKLTLTGNTTLNASNVPEGQIVALIVHQDATGARVITWGTGFTGADPVYALGANGVNALYFVGTASGLVMTQVLRASQEEAEAGTSNARMMTPLRTKQAIDGWHENLSSITETEELDHALVFDASDGDAAKRISLADLFAAISGGGLARTIGEEFDPTDVDLTGFIIFKPYEQTGTINWALAASPVTGGTAIVRFTSNGGTLNWGTTFVSSNPHADLPETLPAGDYLLGFEYTPHWGGEGTHRVRVTKSPGMITLADVEDAGTLAAEDIDGTAFVSEDADNELAQNPKFWVGIEDDLPVTPDANTVYFVVAAP